MNSQLSQLRFWQSLRWWGLWWDRISPLWASFGSRDSKDGYTPRPSKYGSRDASGTSENGSRTSTSNDGWLLSPCFLRLSSGMNGSLINLSGTSMYTTYFSSLYRDVGAYQCLDNLFFFSFDAKFGSDPCVQIKWSFHSIPAGKFLSQPWERVSQTKEIDKFIWFWSLPPLWGPWHGLGFA